ncbi:MAG: HD domain-containing phosphohydrolase [Spirochaetia bacterium]
MGGNPARETEREIKFSLTLKAMLIFLPLIAASLLVSGYLASFTSQRGMTKLATRFLSYKAEELKKHGDNQWELLVANELDNNPLFLEVSKDTFRVFARTIIRSNTELIFAVDREGEVTMSTGDFSPGEEELRLIRNIAASGHEGWIELETSGIERVGHAFAFDPYGWHVFLTEQRSTFYGEIRDMTIQHAVIIIAAVIISALLVILFLRYLLRPIGRVVEGMRSIVRRKDFTQRVPVEQSDEIGLLSKEFNIMTYNLDRAYENLKNTAIREARARRTVSLREHETLDLLGTATDYRDPETGAHITRVGLFCELLAGLLGLSDVQRDLIRHAAPLHDIGKLGIPDSILQKPGPLTTAEFDLMKTHTTISHDILRNSSSKYLRAGAVIALTHHERYDGSGYPSRLGGRDIPLFGRITCLSDVYDSLLSRRPYKEPWSEEDTARYIVNERGRQFDPRIVDLFLSERDRFKAILKAYPD